MNTTSIFFPTPTKRSSAEINKNEENIVVQEISI